MCRFVAYLGENAKLISDVLSSPSNSLIKQSLHPTEGHTLLHADGFGLGWYNLAVDTKPGVYKSILPAWNDHNLLNLAEKITTTCFVAHVRSSTVGDVNILNCHPFNAGRYLFAHNGTIREFANIKRELQHRLSDDVFLKISGQTDSEYFFSYWQQLMADSHDPNLNEMAESFKQAIHDIVALQHHMNPHVVSHFNTVLTDGEQLVATRFLSHSDEEALSLYYCDLSIHDSPTHSHLSETLKDGKFVILASERLTDISTEWREVPLNHIVKVSRDFNVSIEPV